MTFQVPCSNSSQPMRLDMVCWTPLPVTDLIKHLTNTPEMRRMVPMLLQGGCVPPRCRRFIYEYTLDHSEFPCYLLWLCRVQGESSSWTPRSFSPCSGAMAPGGTLSLLAVRAEKALGFSSYCPHCIRSTAEAVSRRLLVSSASTNRNWARFAFPSSEKAS